MWHEINIIGTVGREPELRYTAEGKASCTFSLACNRKMANGKQETIWFRVSAWDKMAENISNYAKKGMTVHVNGRLVCSENGTPRMFQKADGTTSTSFEVVAKEFRIVDFKNGGQQNQQKTQVQPTQSSYTEDIPW